MEDSDADLLASRDVAAATQTLSRQTAVDAAAAPQRPQPRPAEAGHRRPAGRRCHQQRRRGREAGRRSDASEASVLLAPRPSLRAVPSSSPAVVVASARVSAPVPSASPSQRQPAPVHAGHCHAASKTGKTVNDVLTPPAAFTPRLPPTHATSLPLLLLLCRCSVTGCSLHWERRQRSIGRTSEQQSTSVACTGCCLPLPCLTVSAVRPYVSACQFDRFGALLATASSAGDVQLLDMDVALTQHILAPGRALDQRVVAHRFSIPKSELRLSSPPVLHLSLPPLRA